MGEKRKSKEKIRWREGRNIFISLSLIILILLAVALEKTISSATGDRELPLSFVAALFGMAFLSFEIYRYFALENVKNLVLEKYKGDDRALKIVSREYKFFTEVILISAFIYSLISFIVFLFLVISFFEPFSIIGIILIFIVIFFTFIPTAWFIIFFMRPSF